MRRLRIAGLVAAVVPLALAGVTPAASALASSRSAPAAKTLRVGSVNLHHCAVVPGAWCGSINRAWDPSGHVSGSLAVGFAFLPASDTSQPALGTLVPHEGGPGYSTTDSGLDYARMYGPLLKRRNLLLVDQRGTGHSLPVKCPALQNLDGPYAPAAAECAASLGDTFDLFGSALSADDLSAVISALRVGPVDLYGDSYGTFFSQVFLGRHPDQLRSVILDSAYPTYGEDAWYATQTAAMTSSFGKVCARTPSCAALGGSTIGRLGRLLDVVRRNPLSTTATGSDGKPHRTVVDAPALVYVAFAATYGFAPYREFDAAVRAALAGDAAPMARLVAEDYYPGPTGAASAYSEGLDAAVACQDYPQLFDMKATPAARAGQYEAAIQARERTAPDTYAPFTIREYLASFWEEQDWCLQWPVADPAHAAGPPVPIGGHYAAVPTLVLSGELDSITTPAEGAMVAGQIPGARQVVVANSFHVTAEDDNDGCGRSLVQAFVRDPIGPLPAAALECAASVPPVRAAPTYVKSFQDNGSGSLRERAAQTVALTAADAMDRWWESIAGFGTGLRGGTWGSSGDHTATLRLHGYRLTDDLAVSGRVVWARYGGTATVDLTFDQVDAAGRVRNTDHVDGHLTGSWDTRAVGARVHLTGTQGGRPASYGFLAP